MVLIKVGGHSKSDLFDHCFVGHKIKNCLYDKSYWILEGVQCSSTIEWARLWWTSCKTRNIRRNGSPERGQCARVWSRQKYVIFMRAQERRRERKVSHCEILKCGVKNIQSLFSNVPFVAPCSEKDYIPINAIPSMHPFSIVPHSALAVEAAFDSIPAVLGVKEGLHPRTLPSSHSA